MPDKSWQAFVDRIAYQAEHPEHRAIGRRLWAIIFCALLVTVLGLMMQSLGWIQ